MNAGTLPLPVSLANPPRSVVLSIDEAPVPLVLARRDQVTAPFRHDAEARKASIRRNGALSAEQRRHALEMLRQQTEAEMRCALGERNFHAFKAFNQWWFRQLGHVEEMPA